MEILLAIVVASAVIFFGALISMGNDRQRKAIDGLREQVVLWALQDLKLKRAQVAQTVQVADPLAWLNQMAALVLGPGLTLELLDVTAQPPALHCTANDGLLQLIFSPYSPADFRQLQQRTRSRLSRFAGSASGWALPGHADHYELSALNAGDWFEVELPLVWRALTGQALEGSSQRLWVYIA